MKVGITHLGGQPAMNEISITLIRLFMVLLALGAFLCFAAAGGEQDGSYAVAGAILIFTFLYAWICTLRFRKSWGRIGDTGN